MSNPSETTDEIKGLQVSHFSTPALPFPNIRFECISLSLGSPPRWDLEMSLNTETHLHIVLRSLESKFINDE